MFELDSSLGRSHMESLKRNKWIRLKTHYLSFQSFAGYVWKIVRFVILLGLCYIILYPFFIKIDNAFKTASDLSDLTVRFIPKNLTLSNIRNVISSMDYFNSLRNTAIISVIVALVQTAVTALVGYGFARYKFKLNNLLFFMVIFSLVVPPETIIIPLYLRFRFFLGFINLIDTPAPMIVLSLTGLGIKNALYIFLFRQFFRNMPKELEEASYLDGCGDFRTFLKVMLPSATAIIVAVMLLSFSWQWTDTVYSSLFLSDFHVLSNMIQNVGSDQSSLMQSNYVNIASILAIIPVALVYIFTQKYLIQSVERSGLVG